MASNGEIAGVVAGAVVLFVAISAIPIAQNAGMGLYRQQLTNLEHSIIMWRHRRKEAARRARELAALREYGCMRQVGVERWLEEQQSDTVACSRSNNNNNNVHDFGRYTQEPWLSGCRPSFVLGLGDDAGTGLH
ncbi:hypothetical protein GB937_002234 [Aspergillus fischeri]|nr:hypothetical protein GB937_002234 [Aspergillus fischeri]